MTLQNGYQSYCVFSNWSFLQSGRHSKIASKVMDNFCWPWNICAVLVIAYCPQTMKLAIKITAFTFHLTIYINYLCEFHHQFVKSFGASHHFKLIIPLEQNICKCRVPYFTLAHFGWWSQDPTLYTYTPWSGWSSKMWHSYKGNTLAARPLPIKLMFPQLLQSQIIEIQNKTPHATLLLLTGGVIKPCCPAVACKRYLGLEVCSTGIGWKGCIGRPK